MYRFLRYPFALNKTRIPISRQLVSPHVSQNKLSYFSTKVFNELDEFFEAGVHKTKRPVFKLLRETEKKNLKLEIMREVSEKKHELKHELEEKKHELEILKIKTVS
jgi:hypothetical protein